MRNLLVIGALMVLSAFSCFAQDEVEITSKPTIFETITDNSDKSKGVVVLTQDDRIVDLVMRKKEKDMKNKSYLTTTGFRVQVFSSNELRTARAQAYEVEKRIKDKLPELPVYVSYISPFWKVRVGDCLSMIEAQKLRDDLKISLPGFQQETYIVKDQVLTPE